MVKTIKKFLKIRGKDVGETVAKQKNLSSREELKTMVEEGTVRAVKEYREVFEKLAEYDRT